MRWKRPIAKCGGPTVSKLRTLSQIKDFGGTLVHGCFDLVHFGHVRLFTMARQLMPHAPLTVSLTADAFISKGPGRPIFSVMERAGCLAALAVIDYVVIVEDETSLPILRMVRPRYYVKGKEYENAIGAAYEEAMCAKALGAELVYADTHFSSTEYLKRLHDARVSD